MSIIKIGDRFGLWTVVSEPIRIKRVTARCSNYFDVYECRCECGTTRQVRKHKLLRNSKSCGCTTQEFMNVARTKHGWSSTALYKNWNGMIERCSNPNRDSYDRYGGRGIRVCAEWRQFEPFLEWAMSSGYRPGLQIDRRDNDGDYEPANCRWVTDSENKRNTSQNHMLTAFGETKCLTDWSLDARCSVTPSTIRVRLQNGMDPETAVSMPRQTRQNAPKFSGNHVT